MVNPAINLPLNVEMFLRDERAVLSSRCAPGGRQVQQMVHCQGKRLSVPCRHETRKVHLVTVLRAML